MLLCCKTKQEKRKIHIHVVPQLCTKYIKVGKTKILQEAHYTKKKKKKCTAYLKFTFD